MKDYVFIGGRWDGKRFTADEIQAETENGDDDETVYDYDHSDDTTHYYRVVSKP